MGNTAEDVAEKYQITREHRDEFAVASRRKAGEAMAAGDFKDGIVPVTIETRKDEIVIDTESTPSRIPSLRCSPGPVRPSKRTEPLLLVTPPVSTMAQRLS